MHIFSFPVDSMHIFPHQLLHCFNTSQSRLPACYVPLFSNISNIFPPSRCCRPLIWLSSSFDRWHIGSQDDGDVPLWLYVGIRLRSKIERGLPLSLTSWLTRKPRSPVAVGCGVQRRFPLFFHFVLRTLTDVSS